MAYSREGSGLPMVSLSLLLSSFCAVLTFCVLQHDLAQKVHQMSCFFRIWKAPAFYCRDPTGKVASLPISVQVQLRVIVLRGIYSIERDVMRELDVLTSPSQQPKPDDKLALWASMWQLILIYREVTLAARGCLAKSERATGDNQNSKSHVPRSVSMCVGLVC